MTSSIGPNGIGHLLVYRNLGGVLSVEAYPMGATWKEIRSLDIGDLTGDGIKDVALGARNGKLYIARGQPGGSFVPQITNPSAKAVGGGALRLAELNGDRELTSSRPTPSATAPWTRPSSASCSARAAPATR
jgi:hypothetical protein